MAKKQRKEIYIGVLLFTFFLLVFLSFFPNKTLADLEVKYPTIDGSSLSASSKLPDFAIYLFKAGTFLGFFSVFLSLAIAGVMWILNPISAEAREGSRDRVSGAISGLLLLALTYLIVTTINPQLAFFKTSELPPAPLLPTTNEPSGVYFYAKGGCPDDSGTQPRTSSISNLGPLTNQINSVKITQDSATATSYISILYSNPGFSGKCLFINGNQGCQSAVNPQTGNAFASSASIYTYNPSPNGDGVYFYRKSYFEGAGGSLYISNGQIKNSGSDNLYQANLDQLKFNNVPEEEQDCIKYDENGKCAKDGRTSPSLAGENISSIKINGDYLVLLAYRDPKIDSAESWTYCQEFPTLNDINKLGPQQIKWESIRNNGGVIPNFLLIIPI